MKTKLCLFSIVILITFVLTACNMFSGMEVFKESNVNGFRKIELIGGETGNLNRLSFGTSSRKVSLATSYTQHTGALTVFNGTSNETLDLHGCVILDSDDDLRYPMGHSKSGQPILPEDPVEGRRIQITAINANNNAGKIAGSEDGIAFYFKEVDKNMNFRLSAKFYVNNFGFSNTRSDLNGQESFGLMARDFVPQYEDNGDGKNLTMAYIKESVNALGDYTDTDSDKGPFGNLNGYYTGRGRTDGPGGSSNMVMVGGVKRGARVYWRTGVTDPTGEAIWNPTVIPDADRARFGFLPKELKDYSMYGTGRDGIISRPDFPTAGLTYYLTLEKTNSGFKATIKNPEGKGVSKDARTGEWVPSSGVENVFTEKDIPFRTKSLFDIEKDKYYVGFFAGRDARVTITNIVYEESPVELCPPEIPFEQTPIVPSFSVQSPPVTSTSDYTFYARSNVEGHLAISINGKPPIGYTGQWIIEPTNASAEPLSLFEIPDITLRSGNNSFIMVFTPDSKQLQSGYFDPENEFLMSNTNPIQSSFIVNFTSHSGDIWVDPEGRSTNKGTEDSPMDIMTAISLIAPGNTIWLMDGIYSPKEPPVMIDGMPRYNIRLIIPRYNDGRQDALKRMVALNPDKAVFDFRKDLYESGFDGRGFELRGSYWHLEGFHVRNTSNKNKGLTIMGSDNVIRRVKTYYNGDTGLQISGNSTEPKSLWPSNNRIEYCESFANIDEARTDADGFAAKLTVGPGNVFYRCIAHHNVDDGWDLFAKKETGPIGASEIVSCIAYANGRFLNDERGILYSEDGSARRGDSSRAGGNGFKMGGEGIPVKHHAIDCIAWNNDGDGFTSNSDPAILLTHCTSFDNAHRMDDPKLLVNFTIYGAGSGVTTGLDAVINQVFSWYSAAWYNKIVNSSSWVNPPLTNNDDKLEPKSPASGFVWRNGKSVNTLYWELYNVPDTNPVSRAMRPVDGQVITIANIMSETPPFTSSGKAPFCNQITGDIEGDFLEVIWTGEPGVSDYGKPVLGNFMKLQNITGPVPGARDMW